MAQSEPGKDTANSGQLPQETPAQTGLDPLSDLSIYPREAFRDVTPLYIDFEAAPAHVQCALFEEMDGLAKKCGVTETFIGFGHDQHGHWIGWSPLQ